MSGFKPEIDGTDWLVFKATHTIDGGSGSSPRWSLNEPARQNMPISTTSNSPLSSWRWNTTIISWSDACSIT